MISILSVLLCAIFIAQAEWIAEMENPGLFEGDILLDPDEREVKLENTYASIKGGRWPGGKVPYEIRNNIGPKGVNAINSAIAAYHNNTCLRFHKRTSEKAFILFYDRGGGCSSPVGYRSYRANLVSLSKNCWTPGVVIHEIGHSIGLYHEHNRPDRDKYVSILWNNIRGNNQLNFKKQLATHIDSLGTPYDYRSIMHYRMHSFGRYTIISKDPKMANVMGNQRELSTIDKKQINLMYSCGNR